VLTGTFVFGFVAEPNLPRRSTKASRRCGLITRSGVMDGGTSWLHLGPTLEIEMRPASGPQRVFTPTQLTGTFSMND
jgi:hypothetical protein